MSTPQVETYHVPSTLLAPTVSVYTPPANGLYSDFYPHCIWKTIKFADHVLDLDAVLC